MALIPDEKIAEIRDRTDLVQLVAQYVQLRRAGRNHIGLCPFHSEKTPSFNVNPERHIFHCFGCQKTGDAFTFLMEMEKRPFIEVARDLARRAGVELPEPPRSSREQRLAERQASERAEILRVNALAARFYRQILTRSPEGAAGRAYLGERGIGEQVAEAFCLGYAPEGWDRLVKHLAGEQVPGYLAERAGLIVPRRREREAAGSGEAGPEEASRAAPATAAAPPSRSEYYDRFAGRLIFPLHSLSGDILGLGGRILQAAQGREAGASGPAAASDGRTPAKYINSPETLVYKKGRELYGLHAARTAIRKSGRAVVVEGNFDVLSLHQHGIGEALAPMGTALTAEQVGLLRRFAGVAVLALDGDAAGQKATLRSVKLFLEGELSAKVAVLPPGEDPDSLARRQGGEAVESLLRRAVPAVEHFIEAVWGQAERTIPGRVRALGEAAEVLREVGNPDERLLYVGRLAQALELEPDMVWRAMRTAGARAQAADAAQVHDSRAAACAGQEVSPAGTAATPATTTPATTVPTGSGPSGMVATSSPAPGPLPPLPARELELLALLCDNPALAPEIGEQESALLRDPRMSALLRLALAEAQASAGGAIEVGPLCAAAPAEVRDAVARALLAGAFRDLPDPERALCECLDNLRRAEIQAERAACQQALRTARRQEQAERVAELCATLRQLNQKWLALGAQGRRQSRLHQGEEAG